MSLRKLVLIPALLLAAPLAPGQEPPQKEHPVIHVPLPQTDAEMHQQMLELIGQVELRLRQIDKLLSDASSAQRPAAAPGVRTAELVQRSQDEGRQVIEAIDRILELADHGHPGGPGHSS
jgi:hypothetical protein